METKIHVSKNQDMSVAELHATRCIHLQWGCLVSAQPFLVRYYHHVNWSFPVPRLIMRGVLPPLLTLMY